MPVIPHHHRTANGVHMFLGANLRPPHPDHPRLSQVLDPTSVDLSQEYNLGAMDGTDYRIAITDQGALGSCTGFSVRELAEMSARIGGQTAPALSAGWVYEEERRKEGGWPNDSGAFTDDGVDIAITRGVPADSLRPYTGQAATEYDSGAAETDAPKHKFIASRLTIDVRDPNAVKLIAAAFKARFPVYFESYWPEAWFTPNAIGAVGMDFSSIEGGHSFVRTGYIPDAHAPGGLGYFSGPNHWSARWNTQAASYGHAQRVGDFLIPVAAVLSPQTPLMHIAAVVPVAVQPQPQPTQKTLADYDGPIKGVIQSGRYDLNSAALVAYQLAWWQWAEGATAMQPDYQLPSRPHLAGENG